MKFPHLNLYQLSTGNSKASYDKSIMKKKCISRRFFISAAGIILMFCLSFVGCKQNASKSQSQDSSTSGVKAVDLGLSVKWAPYNVGANSEEEYGNYFAWGEVETKGRFTEYNYSLKNTDVPDGMRGNEKYDAARAKMGSQWRTPSCEEFKELIDNCTWTWTTKGEHNGYTITGKNGNSIFLPASGRGGEYDDALEVGVHGYYYTSSPINDQYSLHDTVHGLIFSRNLYDIMEFTLWGGLSIRAVCD